MDGWMGVDGCEWYGLVRLKGGNACILYVQLMERLMDEAA